MTGVGGVVGLRGVRRGRRHGKAAAGARARAPGKNRKFLNGTAERKSRCGKRWILTGTGKTKGKEKNFF